MIYARKTAPKKGNVRRFPVAEDNEPISKQKQMHASRFFFVRSGEGRIPRMVKKVLLGLTFAVAVAQCQPPAPGERRGAAKPAAEPLARYSQALLRKMEPRQLVRELEAELEGAAQVVRPQIMAKLARARQEAGQERAGEDAAEAALREVDKNIREMPIFAPCYDSVIFYAHLVFGRAAVSRGDIEDARRHLAAAGQTTPWPVLTTFGPNMSLAREMLLRSETESVLRFLQECRRFWKGHDQELDRWEAEIRAGKIPDFGINLYT